VKRFFSFFNVDSDFSCVALADNSKFKKLLLFSSPFDSCAVQVTVSRLRGKDSRMTIISRKIGTILCYNQQRQYEFPPRSLVSKIRRRAERQEREISHKSQKKVSKKHVKLECVCRFVHLISFYSFRFRSFLNFVQSPSIFSIYVSAHDLRRCAFFFFPVQSEFFSIPP
jgi:hypothetical protein